MERIKRFSIALTSTLAFSAIILTSGGLSPNVPAAEATAQSGASCNQFILGQSKIQVPTKASSNTAASRNCLLGTGNNGNAVRAIQRSIYYCYGQSLAPYGIDGSFGGVTKSALIKAQGKMGTGTDGVYGINTHNKMSFFISYGKVGSYYVAVCGTDPVKV